MNLFKSYIITSITLFFVIDGFGLIPAYVELTKKFSPKKRKFISIRELFLALLTMIAFYFIGKGGLSFLGIDKTTIHVSGGLVLFLIGIRLIFFQESPNFENWKKTDPFWVPLIAGPSVLALIMIYSQEEISSEVLLLGILTGWFFNALILLFAHPIYAKTKEKLTFAAQRLMGLILVLISVQKILEGLKRFIQ